MRLPPLKLRRGDRGELEARVRSNTIEARAAKRARMILLMADGESNRTIGGLVDLHYNQVGMWRKRYEEFGLAGLEDEERPGRPVIYDHDDVLLLVKLVTEDPPAGATRWTMEALAEAMASHGVPISASQAWRICKALDLKPWQVESWMTSHDPDFWAKASDVCGLYLNPPHNAVVWSVDEKSGMQAKSRINPTKPAIPGKPSRREFEYKRHGTAVLFAALERPRGHMAGWVTDSTRATTSSPSWRPGAPRRPSGPRPALHRRQLRRPQDGQGATEFLEPTPGCTSITRPPMPAGSTRSSCSSPSSNEGCFDAVSSTRSTTWPIASSSFIKDYNRRAAPFRWTYDGKPLRVA
jgi:transposase